MHNSITIRIENFRSLKDVTLELNDVNLLIGPNNSGKTNIFKALQFLGEWLNNGIIKDFKELYFGKKDAPMYSDFNYNPLSYTILVKNEINDITYKFYKIEFFYDEETNKSSVYQIIGLTHQSSFKKEFVLDDKFKIADIKSYEKWFYEYEVVFNRFHHDIMLNNLEQKTHAQIKNYNYLWFKQDEYKLQRNIDHIGFGFYEISNLMKSLSFDNILREYFIQNNGFYSIKVEKTKVAAKYVESEKVALDGSNLVSFIDNMDNNFPTIFDDIKRDFKACLNNEFVNLKYPPFGEDAEGKTLRKLKFFDKDGIPYWADEVSEGVLYFLALVCIIHQPEPPKLLLLEEPENGIHPRRISKIMEYIFDLAEEKGIIVIMTSHSPVLLDEFKDIPENVFIFDKDETTKASTVTKLSNFIEEFDKKATSKNLPKFPKDSSLGDYWLTGLINGVPNR